MLARAARTRSLADLNELAVVLSTTHPPQAISWFITPSQPAKVLWVVTQGGRNAFNRDWSYCCSWAFARYHATGRSGAGERRSHRSSRGRNGFRDPGALLVHVARLAWLLPALALLVMAAQTAGC